MDTKTSLFVLALFAFVIALGWATSEHGMCNYAVVEAVTTDKTKDGAVNCLDYWANRYQTFATQGVADIIAIIAGIFLFRQIELTRDQAREASQQSRSAAGALAIENIKFLIEHAKISSELYASCYKSRAYWLKYQYKSPVPDIKTFNPEEFSDFAFEALRVAHELADKVGNFTFVFNNTDLADSLLEIRSRAEDIAEYAERIIAMKQQSPGLIGREIIRSYNYLERCFIEASAHYGEIIDAVDNEEELTAAAITAVRGNFLNSLSVNRS